MKVAILLQFKRRENASFFLFDLNENLWYNRIRKGGDIYMSSLKRLEELFKNPNNPTNEYECGAIDGMAYLAQFLIYSEQEYMDEQERINPFKYEYRSIGSFPTYSREEYVKHESDMFKILNRIVQNFASRTDHLFDEDFCIKTLEHVKSIGLDKERIKRGYKQFINKRHYSDMSEEDWLIWGKMYGASDKALEAIKNNRKREEEYWNSKKEEALNENSTT